MITESNARGRAIALLVALCGKDLQKKWWDIPNKAFDMRTPSDIWKEDYMRVYNYLMRMSEGEW